jgi:hypothetical protein
MKQLLATLRSGVARFADDTRASVTVEAVIIMPLLAAWFVGSFVFFDGFKNRNTASKATYTIGDILSRRTEAATPEYIDNLQVLFDTLIFTSGGTAMRVTSIEWDGTDHKVLWSYSTKAGLSKQNNAKVKTSAFKDRIPLMAANETVILVETFSDYNPAFNVGWDSHVWENFVVTSPRFASCVAWEENDTVTTC